ncbi:MlaD family protein [Bradyrhizobium sp. NP1]|uniref:MlaD family protein n=1 Tax=Bradyrhizobium sp. NP1 TaxID=3049772 RepID=UPI0025A6169B|nr:MlaD family protein [Bradyrhizobium sp. NP1]WJR78840.1 MlaD family protein [Bradyrhizobium sp. NP1]
MRASNVMIGTTTLAAIAVVFVGWLTIQKIRGTQQHSPLRIVFEGGSALGLRKGGAVNFDGIQAGEIRSIKLESPKRVVAEVMLDNAAPLRKDTVAGIEFQGLTGVAAISLVGGAPAAPPVPLDKDGVPVLNANLQDVESIRDSLHNVDRILVNNGTLIRDAMLSFESYTASLKSKGEAIDSIFAKADDAFAGIDRVFNRIDDVLPGMADGRGEELFEKVKTIRELADSFNKRSGVLMEESRRTLLDVSQAANQMAAKLGAPGEAASAPPRRQKRQ